MATSCDSETNVNCFLPVTGLTAQPMAKSNIKTAAHIGIFLVISKLLSVADIETKFFRKTWFL
jgi:hypothetical protein